MLRTGDWQLQKSGGNGLPDAEANIREFKTEVRGSVIGAVAVTVVGFSQFDWKLGSTAEQMAVDRAQTAVIGVLKPICVEKFQHQANATSKLAEINKSSSRDRAGIIEKGGWATMPGSDTPNSAVASACAERLGSPL